MVDTQRLSLHIGVNVVDPQRYPSTPEPNLFSYGADVESMLSTAPLDD